MRVALRNMLLADLDNVLRIEQQVHRYPWTRGNFTDALNSNYICRIHETEGEISGYAVLMPAVDEAHLLNISIAADQQRQGLGTALLQEMIAVVRSLNMQRILLEVRPANVAALRLYRKTGFSELGLRRGYYHDAMGGEDAIVMEYNL